MMSSSNSAFQTTNETASSSNPSVEAANFASLSSAVFQNHESGNTTTGIYNTNDSSKRGNESIGRNSHDALLSDYDDDYGIDHKCDGSEEPSSKRQAVGSNKRVLKNAREKERSSRIAKQIDQLRDMLTTFGIVVSKGTKSSVLSEVANYIRLLQQQQHRSEIDRNMLIQQIQMIGSGAHGPEAAAAIRHAAAQNGVWSLGNFDGVVPKSAMALATPEESNAEVDASSLTKVDLADYRCIFNSSGVGMAIASMGGAFMDCNSLFSRLSSYSKQELCSLTIFNLTARNDLQRSFDLISRMVSPPMDGSEDPPRQIVLRGSMKYRSDLGMSISLVKGDNGIAKCFVVTLVKNPISPFDTSKPMPVSIESILPEPTSMKETVSFDQHNLNPAFTSG